MSQEMRSSYPKLHSVKFKNGGKIEPTPPLVDDEILDLVNELYQMVENGEVCSLAYIAVIRGSRSDYATNFAGEYSSQLTAGAMRLVHRMHQALDTALESEQGE